MHLDSSDLEMTTSREPSPTATLCDEQMQTEGERRYTHYDDFAHLVPINRRAQQAFDEVASRIAGDDGWQPHARKFVVCADPNAVEKIMRVDHYRLSLNLLPSSAHPDSGWYVGSGYADSPGRVDLLLTAHPKAYDVDRRHFRLFHDPQSSYRLMLETRGEVVLNGQEMLEGNDKRAVDQVLGLGVGDLQYCLTFTKFGLSRMYKEQLLAGARYQARDDPARDFLNPSPAPYTIRDYRVHAATSGGSTSTVSQGYHIATGKAVAVKRIRRTRANCTQVSNEMLYLEKLKHVNICHLNDVEGDRDRTFLEFAQNDYDEIILFLTPAATTTMASVHSTPVYLIKWWSGCCSALKYLHSHGIMHRDVRPHNVGVIFAPVATAIILDLGSCGKKTHSDDHLVGTVRYLAPEVMRIKSWDNGGRSGLSPPPYTHAVDVWGLGLTFAEASHGLVPWKAVSEEGWRAWSSGIRASDGSSVANFLCQQIHRAIVWDDKSRPSGQQLSNAVDEFLDTNSSRQKRQRCA